MKAIHKETRQTKASNSSNEEAIRAGQSAVARLEKEKEARKGQNMDDVRLRIFGLAKCL